MGACKYEHNGVRTCNIDTELFKGYSQYPDLCYFHQIKEIFNEIKEIFEAYCFERKDGELSFKGDSNESFIKAREFLQAQEQINKKYPDFLSFINKNSFLQRFNTLLESKLDFKINTTGFYFPVLGNRLYIHGSQTWNSELIIKESDTGFYDIYSLYSIFKQNDNSITADDIRRMFFESFQKIIALTFSKIGFNLRDLEINNSFTIETEEMLGSNIEYIEILNCQFNGNHLKIQTNKLKFIDNITSKNVQEVNITVPFKSLTMANSLTYPPLFHNDTQINFYDGTWEDTNEEEDDFRIDENSNSRNHLNKRILSIPGAMIKPKNTINGILQNVNLHRARFFGTSTNIHLEYDTSVENINKLNFIHCHFNEGHELYEKGVHPKRLEYSYRYLRKHYDEKGDYIEGNDFHYNYMEAKRKNTKNAWDAFLLWLYGIINGYNTKPERTLYWLFGMFLLFTLLIASVGNFSIKHAVEKDTYVQLTSFPNYCTKLGYSLSYNATNLMPILKSDRFIGIDGWSIGIGIFENISGLVLIALLVMALRNRFRRSKSDDEFK